MDIPEKNCPELTEKTANAIDDASLQELFVSAQMNNLGLCVRLGLQWALHWILIPNFDFPDMFWAEGRPQLSLLSS